MLLLPKLLPEKILAITLIPRMNLTPSESGLPFKFQRREFSISLCFAMTINKNQGQTLNKVGLLLDSYMLLFPE